MDRFLDEHENLSEPHDQMTSPNIRSLLYGDPKRQEGRSSEDFTAALEIVQKVANSSTVDFLLPGKFREDMQTVVLGSIGTHSEPIVSELGRYGEVRNSAPFVQPVIDPLQPQLNVLYGVPVPEDVQAMLPISMNPDTGLPSNENSDCLDRVLELEQSEGSPPFKRPRLQSPVPAELLLPDDQVGFTADRKETVPCSVIATTSACLSPALDNVSLTSSAISSTMLGSALSAFVPASSGVTPGISESNSGRFVLPDYSGTGTMDGVVSTGPGSFVTSGSATSTSLPSASSSVVGLPFDTFPTTAGTLCMEPNLSPDGVVPLEDALAIDSTNPGFQRLTSLDSIEPSLPALETSIDTYASVLAGPGIALENMTMDSLTSMLDGFNPDATSGCPPPPVDSSSGLVSAAGTAVAHDDCSAGDVPPTAAASTTVVVNVAENILMESAVAKTADKGLASSVDSSHADTTIHSAASDTTGSQFIERSDPSDTKSVSGTSEECRPIGTGNDPPRGSEEVSDNVKTVFAETTLIQAPCIDVSASSEQAPDVDTERFSTSPDPELIIDAPASDVESSPDTKPASDGALESGLRLVSDAGATVDNMNNEVDRLSGNQLNIVDVAVCEAMVTEHSTSALST